MKIAFSGGRHYNDVAYVNMVLNELVQEFGPFEVLVGDATGLDSLVKDWAEGNSVEHTVFKADWFKFGKGAGPIRNGAMINHADMLIAFPGGRGTDNAIKTAMFRGVTTRLV